jgi:hypothetical protein
MLAAVSTLAMTSIAPPTGAITVFHLYGNELSKNAVILSSHRRPERGGQLGEVGVSPQRCPLVPSDNENEEAWSPGWPMVRSDPVWPWEVT